MTIVKENAIGDRLYKVGIKHDKGIVNISILASSAKSAVARVLNSELAPRSSVLSVSIMQWIEECESLTSELYRVETLKRPFIKRKVVDYVVR